MRVEGSWDIWQVITWRAKISCANGITLEAFEFHEKINGNHCRKIKYHLMDVNQKCIFRVDTHGETIPLESACHVHVGCDEVRIDDGDERLGTVSLRGLGFPEIFGWVHASLDGKRLPWDQ